MLPNSVSGGTIPTQISTEIWKELYKNSLPPKEIPNEDVIELAIDKIAYDQDRKILLADENTPERYKINALFKKSFIPSEKSSRFVLPEIDNVILSVNNNGILIKLCHAEYCNALVYKQVNGVKRLVFDTKTSGSEFLDKDIIPNKIYTYSVVPYFSNNDKIIKGNEMILDKIKSPSITLGDGWWLNEFN